VDSQNRSTGEDAEWNRQLQLDMLKRENEELGSKLETLVQKLRNHSDINLDQNLETSTHSAYLDEELCVMPVAKKRKVPQVKEVLLVFEGDLEDCDKSSICAKLLHLKRLLHRRLESRLAPSPDAMNSLMHVLFSVHKMSPPTPNERIRVQVSSKVTEAAKEQLMKEIICLLSFTQGLTINKDAVTFVELQEEGEEFHRSCCRQVDSKPAKVQVVITSFNHGLEGEVRIEDATLTELCEVESISWQKFFGKYVNLGWVNKDVYRLDSNERTIICSREKRYGDICLYYPAHLEPFFMDKALRQTLEPGNLLHSLLADHIDAIHFEEWRAGSILVPVKMASWIAESLWELARTDDPWLCFLRHGPHRLIGFQLDEWRCALGAGAGGLQSGERMASLYFEQERQQELIRRKISALERLFSCKQFVSHIEAYTLRLSSQAEDLCGGISLKDQDTRTLDALSSHLKRLSLECESCIDRAMDAIQAVGDASVQGGERVMHEQLTRILRARTAKQNVDRLKDQVHSSLHQRLHSQQVNVERSTETKLTFAMVKELEDGLQANRVQQERLVNLWLGQHELMRSELQRLLIMANSAASAEIGLVALQARFQDYIAFLAEHEAVEDTMLFPMVKSLFPQSARDVDRILDPERHKSVDDVNAGVGKLLQQLHDRYSAGDFEQLSNHEMQGVVDALERLNDYMVGHIRYEEEATMPWLEHVGTTRRPPIAV